VNELKGADVVAYLYCDSVPDAFNWDSLYDLKQATGQWFESKAGRRNASIGLLK
jgi:hypothetical protein